ncbi:anhydro-N-acetylmuramic acid kinase [Sphingobacterium sp. SGR-19]|uniref:anhydro-N-acetylmuramic acid kinase n=1 Tax=Sphingobacterium sp. SGR-19 TaxID=2710886 RepID=UPI0013EE3E3C|nr:anhydro-N-acetylmuramic acid kinase [Sphingobacterium sp. SGR-19]NGM65556.1 anhydro-N-acetylmuramic acid kinase [Sphingobacterium sp. SGR-19]
MNPQIEKLYRIAKQKERRIIGLMSGTSLDGLDIALCRIGNSGQGTTLFLENFITIPYDSAFRKYVREIFAKRQVDQQVLSGLHAYIGRTHGEFINQALERWEISPSDVDLIASHGQTVYHAPQRLTEDTNFPNSTLQIGDGDHIAHTTSIITLSDFRQKHVAAGGEGAPLAAYGDYLLFTSEMENRFLLNIGGISNFTFLPKHGSNLKAYATDLGPGNTMMNQFVYDQFGLEMDENAQIAENGTVHFTLLETLLTSSFLREDFPKTTGPELFNLTYLKNAQSVSHTSTLAPEDILATLNKFAAQTITDGIKRASKDLENVHVYVSGGGLHNPLLMKNIRKALSPIRVSSFSTLGLNPDAKEACLFAVLANETIAGSASYMQQIKDSPAVCMGKISLPY